MTYTVTEVWQKGDKYSSICFSTESPLIFSESGVALIGLGFEFKGRTWHPSKSKDEIIQHAFDNMADRQAAIKGRK